MTAPCREFTPHADEPGVCDGCGKPLVGRQRRWCAGRCEQAWREQHDWGNARHLAKRRDGGRCTREGCDVTTGLEVNHIEPRNGQGYGWGCWNHQSNLETLCHRHHVEVTRQQAVDRERMFRAMERGRRDAVMGQPTLEFDGAAS